VYHFSVDLSTYKKSRAALVEQADALKARLRDVGAAIRGLDTAWFQLSGAPKEDASGEPDIPLSAEYDKSRPFKPLWSHKAIIIEVACRMKGNFGVNELKAAIDEILEYKKFAPLIQKPTISGRLKKQSSGMYSKLELIYQGKGTKPSVYRVKKKEREAKP